MEGNGYKELKAWLERNREIFRGEQYTIDHIVNLAIACGFDRGAVAQWRTSETFRKAV